MNALHLLSLGQSHYINDSSIWLETCGESLGESMRSGNEGHVKEVMAAFDPPLPFFSGQPLFIWDLANFCDVAIRHRLSRASQPRGISVLLFCPYKSRLSSTPLTSLLRPRQVQVSSFSSYYVCAEATMTSIVTVGEAGMSLAPLRNWQASGLDRVDFSNNHPQLRALRISLAML